MTGRLLTARDVAELLGVTPETVLRWVERRGLPARRLTSRAIRFREDELEAWIEAKSTGAATEKRQPIGAAPTVSLPVPTNPPPLTAAASTEKET